MNDISYELIDSNEKLNDSLRPLFNKKHLCVDTEFEARYTYYPKLALVQIGYEATNLIIDPFKINDWGLLKRLFEDKNIIKVIHSAKEDYRTLKSNLSIDLKNVFDTQLASRVIDSGVTLSYQKLVNQYLSIELDKKEQKTDWIKRPLSQSKLKYAASDVYYLGMVYKQQEDKLKNNRQQRNILMQESEEQLIDRAIEREIFLLNHNQFSKTAQKKLQLEVRIYRLKRAIERNRIQNIVINDRQISWFLKNIKIKKITESDLHLSKIFSRNWIQKYSKEFLELFNNLDLSQNKEKNITERAREDIDILVTNAAETIADVANNNGLEKSLLATKRDLYEYFYYYFGGLPNLATPKLNKGWRADILKTKLSKFI